MFCGPLSTQQVKERSGESGSRSLPERRDFDTFKRWDGGALDQNVLCPCGKVFLFIRFSLETDCRHLWKARVEFVAKLLFAFVYLLPTNDVTRGGIALSKGIVSRRKAPVTRTAVTIRGAASNACASSQKGCSLRITPNGRAFIISFLNCRAIGRSLSVQRSGGRGFALRRDTITLGSIRMCKGARARGIGRKTFTIGTLSVGPVMGSLGGLGSLIGHAANVGIERRNKINSSFSLSVGNLSKGSVHCFLSKVPLSAGKDNISLTGLPVGVVSQVRVCGKMIPTDLKASTLNNAVGVVAGRRGGSCLSMSCNVNSFRARGTSLGTRFMRGGAKLVIQPAINVGCSGGSCEVGGMRVHSRDKSGFVCNGPGHFRSNCFSLLTRIRTKFIGGS